MCKIDRGVGNGKQVQRGLMSSWYMCLVLVYILLLRKQYGSTLGEFLPANSRSCNSNDDSCAFFLVQRGSSFFN
jgi:hypothetical protein